MLLKEIINNMHWLSRFMDNKKNKFIVWPILDIFYELTSVLITSAIPAYVVYVFGNPLSLMNVLILLVLCLSLGLINWLNNRLNTNMFWENIWLRMNVTARDAFLFLIEPYEMSLDQQRREMRQASIHYGFEDDNSGVAMFYPQFVATMSSLISLIVITLLTIRLSWIIPIVIIFTVILAIFFMKKYTHERNKLNQNMQDLYVKNDYYNRVAFSEEASQIIRLYNYSDKLKEEIQNSSNKIENLERAILKKRLINTLSLQVLALLRMSIIFSFLFIMAKNRNINLTLFTFYFTICANIEVITSDLWKNARLFLSANDDLKLGRRYIDGNNKYVLDANLKSIEHTDEPIDIEFSHLYFKYPKDNKYIFEDFNLKIAKGEHLALIGKNGAGKSTLMLLLMGYLTPTSGEILINNKNLNNDERRTKFSTMFQDNIILASSIKNNVTMFNDVTDDKLRNVFKQTGLDNLLKGSINSNSQLTKYLSKDGIDLSGGETEIVMLARMLCQNSGAYILDEPSASLDALKEKKLYETIQKSTQKKTIIFISHRLASISLSDNICLLSKGKIIAYGTHDKLLKNSPEYQELFESQSKYYEEDSNEEEN